MSRPRALAAVLVACGLSCRLGTGTEPAARLVVTPDSLAFHGRAGAASLPNQYLTIALERGAAGRWTVAEDGTWFFVPTAGDTVPYFLAVAPRPAGLAAGTYAAEIAVTSGSQTVRIPVTLDLAPALVLSGRWVGRTGSTGIGLDLAHSGDTLTGRGTVTPPGHAVSVAGSYVDPSVSLTLAAGPDTLRFTGSVVDDNTLAGTLRGAGPADAALTLYRQ